MTRFYARRAYLAMVCLAVLASCMKKEAPPTAKEMPGALTKPIESYSADEFYALVTRLSYTGSHERERRCLDAPGCDGTQPAKLVKVQVEAIATQDSIAPSNATQNGTVYVRALNHGDATEARYRLAAGAQFEFFVIVNADTANSMRWTLVQLDTTPKARRLSTVGTGRFRGCDHKWTSGAQADFKTCERAAFGRDSVVKLGLMLQSGLTDPLWTACATGCCVVD